MRRKNQLPFAVAGSRHLSGEAVAVGRPASCRTRPGLPGCPLCSVTNTQALQQGPDTGIPATFLSKSPASWQQESL